MSKQPAKAILTVDIVIFCKRETLFDKKEILLIRRKYPPFQDMLALPGGHVDEDENPLEAAYRELEEETNLSRYYLLYNLSKSSAYADINRDPRGRTVSMAYYTGISEENALKAKAQDDAKELIWVEYSKLDKLKLAFDHNQIITEAYHKHIW